MEFSLRPLDACAVTTVRPHHVVEDRITLFVRPFGAYHVYGTFAGGTQCAYPITRLLLLEPAKPASETGVSDLEHANRLPHLSSLLHPHHLFLGSVLVGSHLLIVEDRVFFKPLNHLVLIFSG